MYFAEFPPGQAIARLGIPERDELGDFLSTLGGSGAPPSNGVTASPSLRGGGQISQTLDF